MQTADELLASKAMTGDIEAFEELVTRFQQPIFRLAYRMLGQREEAEDAAQEVFVKVYRKIDQFDADKKFSPWLYRIAVNTCISKLRGKKYTTFVPFEESDSGPINYIPTNDPNPLEVVEQRVLNNMIWDTVGKMPDSYRTIIILRYQLELTNQEIADTLGVRKDNVEVKLHRARKSLREALKETLDEYNQQ
ncbi:MAG: sigma-70 family RNA polymerase sigma factor [Syntrophomonadaceae bacterium]|nr:sigma-70 family RNA polymerase sigma factor [Syntrophomonadaceae bacterium]